MMKPSSPLTWYRANHDCTIISLSYLLCDKPQSLECHCAYLIHQSLHQSQYLLVHALIAT